MDEAPKTSVETNEPTASAPTQTPSEAAQVAADDPSSVAEPEVTSGGEPEEDNEPSGIRSALSTIAILIIAPLIALTLTAFVFQSYEVDGPSMETTLQNHDRLIVYKLPRTIARITGKNYVPHRSDIIIFSRQDSFEFGTAQKRQLIKRVMAFAGERVVVKDGILTVYNSEHPEGFRPDSQPYGKVIVTTPGDVDLVVPEGYIYVCGDNRPNSLDSRAFGPVPLKDVVGKLSIRVYPFGKSQVY